MTAEVRHRPPASVVMSVYNGKRSLREAVESVLRQNFADFEFIIIDDGSTDRTWQLLKDFAERDSRIVLLRNKENIGLTRSLNRGLQMALGQYIVRQDADDVSMPERLSIQLSFLEKHPEVGVVGSAVRLLDGKGRVVADAYSPADHESICAHLLLTNCLCHSSIAVRSSLLKQCGGYDSSLPYAQDYDLWWRLSRITKLCALPTVLVSRGADHPTAVGVRRRMEQLGCALQISLRALRHHLGGRSFDETAYARFWWAYQGYAGDLQRGDTERLQSLWEALAARWVVSRVWGPKLMELAGRLFYSYPYESLQMMRAATGYFEQAMLSAESARMVRHLVTAPMLWLCRRIKAFGMSNLKSEIPSAARTE